MTGTRIAGHLTEALSSGRARVVQAVAVAA
jgi:hypothetical protein